MAAAETAPARRGRKMMLENFMVEAEVKQAFASKFALSEMEEDVEEEKGEL